MVCTIKNKVIIIELRLTIPKQERETTHTNISIKLPTTKHEDDVHALSNAQSHLRQRES